jgi:putative hydrolase of the HAD superfamily
MAKQKIQVISFDLWDTVFIDDSDEPKRAQKNLAPKPVERRNLVERFLRDSGQPVARDLIDVAYDTTDAAFYQVWYGQQLTWPVAERLGVLLKGLGRELPADQFDRLVRLHEDMELDPCPDLAPHITEALAQLQGKYRLAVVSDAIFTPGRGLREILAHHNILGYFEAFAFSDELGCSKPRAEMFEHIAETLGVPLDSIVHIGDREQKDIDGAQAVGAQAIFTTVVKDRGADQSKAEALCSDYRELPALVNSLDQTKS